MHTHADTHYFTDTQTYIHSQTHKHMRTHIHRHGHSQTHIYTQTHTHTHTHTLADMRARAHTHIYTRRYVYATEQRGMQPDTLHVSPAAQSCLILPSLHTHAHLLLYRPYLLHTHWVLGSAPGPSQTPLVPPGSAPLGAVPAPGLLTSTAGRRASRGLGRQPSASQQAAGGRRQAAPEAPLGRQPVGTLG